MIEPQILGRDLDEIRTIVAMWQEALGLDEWSIDAELIEARQMPGRSLRLHGCSAGNKNPAGHGDRLR